MTTAPHQTAAATDRPATATAGAVLIAVTALAFVAQPLSFLGLGFGFGTASYLPLLIVGVQTIVPAAAYAVCVPGLLRGRGWARVAVTALGVVALLTALPSLLLSLTSGADPLLLVYVGAELTLAAALVLLWTAPSRAWFGPVT